MYEFSEVENTTIKKAATWATALGIAGFVQAAFALSGIASNTIGTLINIAIQMSIALAFFNAGRSMRLVVETKGDDIAHMMTGLEAIGRAFQIRIVLASLLLGFIVLAIGLALALS